MQTLVVWLLGDYQGGAGEFNADFRYTAGMRLRFLGFLWCALMLSSDAGGPAAFQKCAGALGTHDDSGDALAEAEREFRLALKLDPKFAAAQAYLGLIALESEHKEEARSIFEKALQMDANCAEARVGLAELAMGRAQWTEAIELLRRAVVGAPRNRLALDRLAWALTAESQQPTDAMWREAMGYWRRLVGMDKNDRDSQQALAKAHVRFGEWKDAERGFREVLRIGQTPEDSDVWVLLRPRRACPNPGEAGAVRGSHPGIRGTRRRRRRRRGGDRGSQATDCGTARDP